MGTASRKKKATIDFFTGWDDGLEGICNEIVYASRAEKKSYSRGYKQLYQLYQYKFEYC